MERAEWGGGRACTVQARGAGDRGQRCGSRQEVLRTEFKVTCLEKANVKEILLKVARKVTFEVS